MDLLKQLRTSFSGLKFVEGYSCSWSFRRQEVTFHAVKTTEDEWSLLHEVAHGALGHHSYKRDIELLRLEVDAWEKAKKIAVRFGKEIDDKHIEQCLDTYRDWLHQRSTCPNCSTVSFQAAADLYVCYNCHTSWKVGRSRQCRVHRRQVTPVESSH